MILRYHRQNFKPLYLASVDVAKAFDCVTHNAIRDTLKTKGLPAPMIDYIANVYERSVTRLACGNWESDPIHPTCGVKQGDPLSPIIFNMIMDRLIRQIPPEVGVEIGGKHHNVFAFADDLIFVASTPTGLQQVLDLASTYLAKCGLNINATKSFTIAIRNVPHVKKTVVDCGTTFTCSGQKLPALRRPDEWKYLGVPFTPEGCSQGIEIEQLNTELSKLSRAPLKPQQRLFALRVMVLPSLYHLLTLGNTTLSRLKKIDRLVRRAVKGWLDLPHDVPSAYIHAKAKDGGLSIPSMRWQMPLMRLQRLKSYTNEVAVSPYLTQEMGRAQRRLREGTVDIDTTAKLEQRWANLLHASVDGQALKESSKVPQQHQWITDGTRLLSGRDFINSVKLRINAMPTRSRTSRGRPKERSCRAGCNAVETLNHVLQQCHRTHRARIERHQAIVSYTTRALSKIYDTVDEEPRFITTEGLRKPDIIARSGRAALLLDVQVVSERADLEEAHKRKVEYYKPLEDAIRKRYNVQEVAFSSVTLSCRGIWSKTSAQNSTDRHIFRKTELKIISSRTLIGGLNSFWRFNRTTSALRTNRTNRTGVG
ncbi:hypothetical protein KPH14_000752 [Odynerus spinipes]|uniref:Reverse transcriptase domain-containing protein n=1 Tax=Odynerus spinipes TaxID=1348599 RepID=A0AAD9VKH5_9HYME|nr:hypothetical protein KPH14_000752 [Odynerus spinipes]